MVLPLLQAFLLSHLMFPAKMFLLDLEYTLKQVSVPLSLIRVVLQPGTERRRWELQKVPGRIRSAQAFGNIHLVITSHSSLFWPSFRILPPAGVLVGTSHG